MSLLSRAYYHLVTIYLAIRSNIKAIIGPALITSAYLGPLDSAPRILHVFLWLKVQLIHFELAQQLLRTEEDRLNKPYRPIASGRLSVQDAGRLRWIVTVFAFVQSRYYSSEVLTACVANTIVNILYTDLDLDKAHWFIRQLLLACIYTPYHYGAVLIAGPNSQALSDFNNKTMLLSLVFFLTTGHVQDFKDVAGDAAVGRNTLPMVYPTASRFIYAFFMIFWTTAYAKVWEMQETYAAIFVGSAVCMAFFALFFRSHRCDTLTYRFYCAFTVFVFLVPAHYHYKTGGEFPNFGFKL